MEVFLRVDINIVAIIILGLVFFIANWRLDKKDSLNRFFLRVSQIIILQLFAETATCIINRRSETWLIPVTIFLHMVLFLVAPLLTYHYYTLIHGMVTYDKAINKRNKALLLVPLCLNAAITVLSPVYKFIFYIDEYNVYSRGRLFYVSVLSTYFYLFMGLALLVANRKQIVRQDFVPLFLFTIIPIIGGAVQSLFYGALLMWSSSAFALVILYFYLQQRIVQLDDLTGAWNRSSFEQYIAKSLKQNLKIGIIYVDLDDLKQINDMYGHIEGDFAIKTSIQIIKSAIRNNDIVVRMGGDEFIVVLNNCSDEGLKNTMDRLESAFLQYNGESRKDYKIDCSFGADIFNSNYSSIEQFLHHVDTLMYTNKKVKKARV